MTESSLSTTETAETTERRALGFSSAGELGFRLVDLVHRLAGCRELAEVVALLRDNVRKLVCADGITVVLREGNLCHYADEDAVSPLWAGQRFPMEACISGWCMLKGKQVSIPDIYVDPRIPHDAYRPTFVRSLAMTPIGGNDAIGALGAYWSTHHEATPTELYVLGAIASAASTALENVRLIAELKQAQESLWQLAGHLAQADRRKDEFLATLSHELRNPLAPLRNSLHLLRTGAPTSEPQRQAYEMMDRQVNHLVRLVDDLMEVSRISRGVLELRTERVEAATVVRNAVETSHPAIQAAGHRLDIEVPAEPLWLEGDAVRLAQIVANLLNNAAAYTDAGGHIRLRARRSEPRALEISIRDNGRGIAPEALPHIFDMFTRADRTSARGQGGLGIGLALARRLAEMHGGSLQATSPGPGQGSEFTLRLPLAPTQQNEAITRDSHVEGPRLGQRVLVVDDNQDAAQSLAMVVGLLGAEARAARSGPEALDLAKSFAPHVVLLDIGMPGMDGYEVARRLRMQHGERTPVLIALTGWGQEGDRERARSAGFDHHLVKPADISVLRGILEASGIRGES